MKGIQAKVEILTQDEILQVHKAACNVLAKTGIGMPNEEALRRCERAGAIVDYVKGVMRIPVSVTEDFVAELKKRAYKPEPGLQPIAGGISTQVFVTDYGTKSRRYGNSDDIMRGIALVKHLKNIPGCSAVTVPSDVPSEISDLHAHHLIYKYSEKPGGTYIINPAMANYIMDMAEVVGQKSGYLFETVSPLSFRKETLEMALTYADRGHGLGIAPMIMSGSTGPVTMAGALVLMVAEVLASLFGVYALSGEYVPWFCTGSHTTDPKTLLCSFGCPNMALIGIGVAQMSNFYGLPGGSNAALSDALLPDFQCGFEKSLSGIFSLLAGSVSMGCQGIAGADQGFSFEQLVIDNEWIDAYNYVLKGYEVNADTLAEEVIAQVGIGGNFVAEEHTGEYLRENWWQSRLFDRYDFDMWQQKGADTLLERAHALVREYTEGYAQMQPCRDDATVKALDEIADKAKRSL